MNGVAGEIAWLVRGLPYKQEFMSSMYRIHIRKADVMAHNCNSHSGETEIGESLRIASQLASKGAPGQ